MRFEGGYLSPYFVTDPERMECVYEDVYILIHERKISDRRDLLSVLDNVAKTGKPLLIIAEEVDGEALANLVFNKVCGRLKCVAVKAPGFGNQRKAMLEDIAAITSARMFVQDSDVNLENVTLLDFGRANRVIVDEHNTMIESALESKI
jgi:chaperonin GroEL